MQTIVTVFNNHIRTGIEFVISHAVGLQCFITVEMVTWLQDNIDDIESRKQAVRLVSIIS